MREEDELNNSGPRGCRWTNHSCKRSVMVFDCQGRLLGEEGQGRGEARREMTRPSLDRRCPESARQTGVSTK